MKPAPFDLDEPTTVAEAVAILGEHGDDAKVLAGGQSLLPLLALRLTQFARLVDVSGIAELQGIEREDGRVRVGAMVRQSVAERDERIAVDVPLLARAIPHIGHLPIRNRGTVGGSTAHADPASELPAVALALDASLEVAGPQGRRTVAAGEFFLSTWSTALDVDEVLVAIRYPVWGKGSGFAVRELARRPGDFALAGVAAGVRVDAQGTVDRVAVALFGMGATPIRASAAEAAVVGQPAATIDLDAAGALAVASTVPPDDVHAPVVDRQRVGALLVRRALRAALEEAADGAA